MKSGRKTLAAELAEFFKRHPGEWIEGVALGEVAGRYAWRTRVSDVRLYHGMNIVNRQRRLATGAVVSEYSYIPLPTAVAA